jgi:hypothetical protein
MDPGRVIVSVVIVSVVSDNDDPEIALNVDLC